ncbi:type 1 glutamine amidotransferase [Kushneria sinocarnis]|nr:type 1 glutamine amidotransferase [Kushneria sinocarnis]
MSIIASIMHIYFLQHTPAQGPGRLADWLASMGHSFNMRPLYTGELPPPQLHDFDALIVLGGAMSIHDDAAHPWIRRERKLIDRVLKSSRPVMGIGFGAQLIADALGAIVSRSPQPELGWHRVTRSDRCDLDLPESFDAFHWHQEIFGLPEDSTPIGASEASPVQGFSWDGARVVALQCHLETTRGWLNDCLDGADDSVHALTGPWVQSFDEMRDGQRRLDRLAPTLDRLMTDWLQPFMY